MGKILSSVGGIIGLGGNAKKVSTDAVQSVQTDQTTANKAAQALYATEGGVLGSILNPGQTSTRQTLLGN